MRRTVMCAVLLLACGCTPESAKQLNEQNRESLKNLEQRVEQDLVPAVRAMVANATTMGIWLGVPRTPLAPVVDAQGQTSQIGLDQSAAARKELQAAVEAREWWKGLAVAGLTALLGALGVGAPWLARMRSALAAAKTLVEERGVQVTALVKGAQDIVQTAKDKGPVSTETIKAALSGWQAFMGVKDSLAPMVKRVKAEWSAAENRAV